MTDKKSTKLWEKLLAGVRSAVELRIITRVGEVEIEGELADPKLRFGADGHTIATSINLVEGDITSVVPDALWAPDKQAVRDFHEQQVEQAKLIVERNLRLIGELGTSLAKAIAELKQVEG
jgi:hypothetical protein